MSSKISFFAAISAAAKTSDEAAIPSPGTVFSETARALCVEPISVVLSGVTNPLIIARPTSIISDAIKISTSPAAGASEKTGSLSLIGAISI